MGSEATNKEIIGGFRRLAVIGAGAQGKVWKAQCVEDIHGIVPVGTVVALKVKYEHGDNLDAQWQKTESRIHELMVMDHPNVVRYLGCFREKALDQEMHVVVQEFLEGETLKERIDALNRWNPGKNRLGLDVDTGIGIISQAAAGLGYTASLGIFHRDVKPGNIFLCKDGKVKLIDFGVARQSDGTITEEGNIRGSWNYLAPDFTDGVFRGDQQSDIFSVGVVLHEIITGRLPYQDACGDDTAAYFTRWSKTSEDTPIRIVSNTRRLLLGIDGIFDRALTPDRNERYKDFGQLQRALEGIRFVEQKHGDKTFRRLQFIGEGGFGEVFKARWLERDQPVAVKMLKSVDSAERFLTEAEVMKDLNDPCFTRFIDFFEEEGRSFLVMSFLDGMPGSSLRDAINRSRIEARLKNDMLTSGGLPKELVLSAFERYARGLGLMHKHRPTIVHRDIKPTNLYFPVGHPERVAIMDFGIVRTGDGRTASGLTPCTYDYAPPEIVMTLDRGGPGMDIFALGLCMYEALTGKTAYPRITGGQSGMLQFLERCQSRKAPVFDDPRVTEDPDLLKLLQRMTDPDIGKRLTSADAVAVEIRKLFYRDVEGTTTDTVFFDPNTDKTVAINDVRLRAWFDEWKKANPVDEKRLMEMYREQWQKEHESGESASLRKLPKPSRWKTPLLLLSCMVGTAVAVIFGWPSIKSLNRSPSEKKVDLQLIDARLEIGRTTFAKEFEDLIKIEPVHSRRTRLAKAESRLGEVIGRRVDVDEGLLYVAASTNAVDFHRRLESAKRLCAGVVDNRCGDKVLIDGQPVHDGETKCFAFADGNPASRVVSLRGYEPLSFPDDFDGRTLVLTRDDFVAAPVEVKLPKDMDVSVICLFDDKPTNALSLKPRTTPYQCVFRKQGYVDKIQAFRVALGTDVQLEPLGVWDPAPVEVTVGELADGVVCTVDGNTSVGGVMLKPGDHVVKYLLRGYDDLVSNFKVEIGVGRKVPLPSEIGKWKVSPVRVSVPYLEPGVTCRIDGREEKGRYRDMEPGDHVCQYERVGYVTQSNLSFVVALATPTNLPSPMKWVAEKVKVTIPELKNTESRLDGRLVSGTILLMPDRLFKLDYVEKLESSTGSTSRHQRVSFFVQNNTPMVVPLPDENNWVYDRVTPALNPKPKPRPFNGPVSEQARKEYETANEYFDFGEYGTAFEHYHKAFKAGYPFNDQDVRNVEKSYKEALAVLNGHIEDWKRRPAHKDSHRNIEEYTRQRGELIKKYREIGGK